LPKGKKRRNFSQNHSALLHGGKTSSKGEGPQEKDRPGPYHRLIDEGEGESLKGVNYESRESIYRVCSREGVVGSTRMRSK